MLLFATYSYAETYWVSSTGTASWSNCSGVTPISGTAACALATANTNAAAGDTVYLRAGTYSITGTAITPSNSGTSASNMIIFSGYESEVVTVYGVNDITGRAARGINLSGKNYIKVTKIIFTNLATYLYITDGSHHNEISYCTFKDMRDISNVDIIKTGIHTGATGSSTVLEDSSGGLTVCSGRDIYNIDDGSYATTARSATDTAVTHPILEGGTNNYWSNGDRYKCTWMINWGGSYLYEGGSDLPVSHNWIHHNTFKNYGAYSAKLDAGVALELGVGTVAADANNNYNTIENNQLYAAGHHVLGVNAAKYNVIRNNYIHNEGWYSGGKCASRENGVCGYRVISATVPSTAYGGYSLWEGNRIGHGAAYGGPHLYPGGSSGGGTTLATPANIYRYNDHFNNALYGLRLGASLSTAGNDNKVYNNTFYHNGYGADDDIYASDDYRTGIHLYNNSCANISGSVIINNLFYDNWTQQYKLQTTGYYPAIWAVSAENLTCNTIKNNFNVTSSYPRSSTPVGIGTNPLFTDPDVSAPLATTKPDLSLRAGSPAIDKGVYLTQANGAGSNTTTLIVDDARFFQDGTWGSDLARATLQADQIAIGAVRNVHRIVSINYDTNTITLATPTTWADDAYIWLFSKSDGERVFYGPAPDMGAHEYIYVMPPQNLRMAQ